MNEFAADKDIVLIIGASSGLGLACYEAFLKKNYTVVGVSRRGVATKDVQPGGIMISADVCKNNELQSLHAVFEQQGKWPRTIVYCAGVGSFGSVKNYTEANWDKVFQTNVRGVFALMGCFAPNMQEGGRVVLVGSTAGLRPFKSGSMYAASKAALHAYAKALREELRQRKITVTLCIPGTMATPFFGQMPENPGELLPPDYVASLIMMAAEAPPQVEVSELVVQPIKESV